MIGQGGEGERDDGIGHGREGERDRVMGNNGASERDQEFERRRRSRRLWLVALGAAILWSMWMAGLFTPDRQLGNPRGLPLLLRALGAAATPDVSPEFLALVARESMTTLGFAVLGSLLSVTLGSVGGALASRTWWSVALPARGRDGPNGAGRAAWLLMRAAIVPPRALHEVLWGVLLLRILGLNPLAAVLAIGLPYGAITAKVFSELVDEADPAGVRALRDAGARPLPAFVYGAIPNALPELVSYAFYRLECSIRAAAVLGIFGAGGLGFQLQLSLRSLRYEEMWTIVAALVCLTGIVDLWSGRARRALGVGVNPRFARIRGRRAGSVADTRAEDSSVAIDEMSAPRISSIPEPGPTGVGDGAKGRSREVASGWWPHLAILAVALPVAWFAVRPDVSALFDAVTRKRLSDFVAGAWPPSAGDLGISGMASATADTLAMSILAAGIAATIALPLSILAARNVFSAGGLIPRPGIARGRLRAAVGAAVPPFLARTLLLVLRAVPAPLWALLVLFVVRPGILPGAIAIGIYTGGIVGRLSAEVIENIAPGPPRALATAGAPAGAVLAYGVAPIALPRFLLYIVYRWEECVRATVAVGLVGAGGLGQALRDQLVSFHDQAIAGTVVAFIGLAVAADVISARIRGAFR